MQRGLWQVCPYHRYRTLHQCRMFFFHFTAPSPSYDEALKLYSKALDKHPNTAVLWKRKVAVHKARGDMEEAVKELCQFLEV